MSRATAAGRGADQAKRLLRPAKELLQLLAERAWMALARIAGARAPRRTEIWSSPGDGTVLVVAPHPDDEAYACGGTLLLHRRSGDVTHVACVTDGRRSRALGLAPEEMARRRREEIGTAARLLEIDELHWLGFPEGEWELSRGSERLRNLIVELAPDVIYAPSRIDFHPEHLRVSHALALALADPGARSPVAVRVFQVQVPLTSILTNLVAPTDEVGERSRAALQAYATQFGSIRRSLRQKRYAGRFHACGREAEEFWQMEAPRYRLLHQDASVLGGARFRGLRDLALLDPLAYVTARRERRRILERGA